MFVKKKKKKKANKWGTEHNGHNWRENECVVRQSWAILPVLRTEGPRDKTYRES